MGLKADLDDCRKCRPHRDSIPGSLARNESLYRLSYPGPRCFIYIMYLCTLVAILLNIFNTESSVWEVPY